MKFIDLGLSKPVLRAIEENGYESPTPIQQQAIPAILAGEDMLAGAQTGTGKTAAFTLPIIEILTDHKNKRPGKHREIRALILCPTRELVCQVEENVKGYARNTDLKSAAIFGGASIDAQIHKLKRGFDILVATPGRLLDHIQRRTVYLSHVEVLVLDEADRMLDMGFIRDIRRIAEMLPKKRQNLMFSATYSKNIKELAGEILHKPVQIEVAQRNATAEGIKQVVHPVDKNRKQELLAYLIGSKNWRQVLVFVRTKHGADRLAKYLIHAGLNTTTIHGNKTQGARSRALNEFKTGAVRVLVATDVAARGLDIHKLPHVVNFDLPKSPEDYVHRIGRTARAGNEGAAVSLLAQDDKHALRNIERLLQYKFTQEIIAGFELGSPPQKHEKYLDEINFSDEESAPAKKRESGFSKRDERKPHDKKSSFRSDRKSHGERSSSDRSHDRDKRSERSFSSETKQSRFSDKENRSFHSDKKSRGEKHERPFRAARDDRSEKNFRGERGARSDRNDRGERDNRSFHSDKKSYGERTSRSFQSDRSERGERAYRTERSENRENRNVRGERGSRGERDNRSFRSDKKSFGERSSRPFHSDRKDLGERGYRGENQGRGERDERSASDTRDSRFSRMERDRNPESRNRASDHNRGGRNERSSSASGFERKDRDGKPSRFSKQKTTFGADRPKKFHGEKAGRSFDSDRSERGDKKAFASKKRGSNFKPAKKDNRSRSR